MPKRLNPNLAKIHRNYTVEEIAALYGLHKNTVRAWIRGGLQVCDDKRPALILGNELRTFLQQKRQARKRRCKLFELYCMRCRVPRRPAGNMVDYIPMSESTGRLIAICPDCTGMMNRYASKANLAKNQGQLDVSIPKALEHISETSNPLVNSEFS